MVPTAHEPRPPARRRDRQPRRIGPGDRRALERAGWRTLLEFHEDHVRDAGGRLIAVAARWTAEAEHPCGRVLVATAGGPSPDAAWARLREAAARLQAGDPANTDASDERGAA